MRAAQDSRLLRLRGFLRKEALQVKRDPSSMLLAIVMPIVLLFLFGYGVSLNPRETPIAVVMEDSAAISRDLVARLEGSGYFEPIIVRSAEEGEALVKSGRVGGLLRIPESFERHWEAGSAPRVQLILNGVDANRASLLSGYVSGAFAQWSSIRKAEGLPGMVSGVSLDTRTWFNESNESRNFLVPGLIVLIMTLIGALLTALVIAREWERGTMEAILATPLRTGEFLIGKTLPYYGLGILGLMVSVLGGVFIFDVPLRGSIWVLFLCSSLFLFASLGMGLALSALLRVQFVAAQAALIAGFLPAFFLSGLLFDLESAPVVIQWFSFIVPARYFVEICQTLFLAGDVWEVILPASGALLLAAGIFFLIARLNLSGRLK